MTSECCTHLKVEWRTRQNADGSTTGWWECLSGCGSKFSPVGQGRAVLESEIATLRARVEELERDREHLRKDLVDIAQKCGVGCPSQDEAVRRIAVYIADHKTPAEREVIEAAIRWNTNDPPGLVLTEKNDPVMRLQNAVAALLKERSK